MKAEDAIQRGWSHHGSGRAGACLSLWVTTAARADPSSDSWGFQLWISGSLCLAVSCMSRVPQHGHAVPMGTVPVPISSCHHIPTAPPPCPTHHLTTHTN